MFKTETSRPRLGPIGIGLVALLLITALGVAVSLAQRLPDGPEPIAWDRTACAHCRMHVGDPRFAAQLQTASGEVLSYDDPGCLLADLAERKPQVHAIWLHDSKDRERWLRAEEADFVPSGDTPMGYGLAVVRKGTASGGRALDFTAATEHVLQSRAVRR